MSTYLCHAPIRILLLRNPLDASLEVNRALFEQTQFDVVESESLPAALPELHDNGFQAAIVEIGARNSNVECLLRLRDEFPRLPLIAVVRSEHVRNARAAIGDDAQDFLTIDHVSPETLAWSIHNALQRCRHNVEIDHLARGINQVDDGVRRMNRAVGRQYRRIARVTESVGHDFRASLTVVSEHAALVRDGLCGEVNPEQKCMLTTACDRIDGLCRMVYDAQYFSKLCAGHCRPQRRCCRIHEIVGPVTTRLAAKAAIHGLTFSSSIESQLETVYCDPEMVVHILETLGTSAITSCSEHGHVRVQVENEPDLRQIRIDLGCNHSYCDPDGGSLPDGGVRPQHQRFCLQSAVAKELVDRNFGRLTERSVPGKDLLFSFDIPFAFPEEIVGRYLNWLRRSPVIPGKITALRTRVEGCLPDGIERALDRQLNDLTRPDELLLRIRDLEWLTIIPASRSVKRRIQKLRTSLNRVRMKAWGASFRTINEGIWPIDRRAADLVDELKVHDLHSARRQRSEGRVTVDAPACLAGTTSK